MLLANPHTRPRPDGTLEKRGLKCVVELNPSMHIYRRLPGDIARNERTRPRPS